MADYNEFFQGIQQLINGFNNFINNGMLPRSEGIGQLVALVGATVFFLVIIFVLIKYAASGRAGLNLRF